MFIAEKVGKEWTMDQAPQYAIDHVANSKKNIFEFFGVIFSFSRKRA